MAEKLTFQQETPDTFIADCMDLLIIHWDDVALNKDEVKLNPDWDLYMQLHANGSLHATTARTLAGELVGYCVYMVTRNLNYKDHVWAEGDVFFLHKDYRKGLSGVRLLKAAEAAMVSLGVTKIINKVKLHKDVGVLFERMGYTAVERVYVKGIS